MTLRDRLHGLASFVPEFEAPEFTSGKWAGGELVSDNVRTMPYFDLSEPVHRLLEACYELSWVRSDFSWPEWSGTPEAHRLMVEPGALESASVEDIERLLTTWLRFDRFCEGHLGGVCESGHMLRVLRRAAALERALP